MKKLIVIRRISQISFSTLFVYTLWSTTYPLTGFIHPKLLFELDPLVTLMTALSERVLLPGIKLSVVMLALTFVLGRFFCGWICPLGACLDLSRALSKKLRVPSDNASLAISKIKYAILAVISVFALAGTEVAWVLDPIGLAARFVSLNLIPTATLCADKVFIFLIRTCGLYGPVKDLYKDLKMSWSPFMFFLGRPLDSPFWANARFNMSFSAATKRNAKAPALRKLRRETAFFRTVVIIFMRIPSSYQLPHHPPL